MKAPFIVGTLALGAAAVALALGLDELAAVLSLFVVFFAMAGAVDTAMHRAHLARLLRMRPRLPGTVTPRLPSYTAGAAPRRPSPPGVDRAGAPTLGGGS